MPAVYGTLLSKPTGGLSCMYSKIAAPFDQCLFLCILCILQESVEAMWTAIIANVPDLAHFFWDHLRKDLGIIGKSLSHGENEVLMFLHRVIHHLAGIPSTIGKCMAVLMECLV